MKGYKWIGAFSLAASLFTGGCQDAQTFSSEDVVTKMLEGNKAVGSYYAEGIMNEYEGDKKIRESTIMEWHDAKTGKRRVEIRSGNNVTRSVNDGKQIITYDEALKTAFRLDAADVGEMGAGTPKEQLIGILDKVKNTHKIEVVGEDTVINLPVHHVKATMQEKGSLFGDMDLWADQKTWLVLKSSSTIGENKVNFEYTKLDQSPTFDEKTFVLDLPQDVKITSLSDINPAKKVSLEEAEAAMKAPFYYWESSSEVVLAGIELNEWKGEINRNELTLNYTKGDVPYFSLSVFPAPKEEIGEGLLGEKPLQIRGIKGSYMEAIRSVMWDEKGLRYTVMLEHPDLTVEQMVKLAEEMKWSEKK
ncbi:LolA family protein [Brevibacillus reuszeri]|uniref:LolA family protein n=1 Tax=Brevibacillus reuszeri TaxID=54915 RepID=UPI003D259EDA